MHSKSKQMKYLSRKEIKIKTYYEMELVTGSFKKLFYISFLHFSSSAAPLQFLNMIQLLRLINHTIQIHSSASDIVEALKQQRGKSWNWNWAKNARVAANSWSRNELFFLLFIRTKESRPARCEWIKWINRIHTYNIPSLLLLLWF